MNIITHYECSNCGYETEKFMDYISHESGSRTEKCPNCNEET